MAYQLFVPTFHTEECLEEIRECLDKGWTGLGFKTVQFEEAWKDYTGLPYAHFLNSATAGLHLAVKILKEEYNWQEGDEIISTPLTFVSTNHAVKYENMNVVFADVDEYLCLDPEDVLRKITPRTKAIIYVGYGGSTGQYKEIVRLCKEHNLALILDAAHMAGTRLEGKVPGEEAEAVVYSFQAVKNLPTGDSGMLCFREERWDERARKYSWLGINKDTYKRSTQGHYKWKYDVECLGYKYHGNSIMASLGLVQLKYLEEDNTHRRYLAQAYREILQEHEGIQLIPIPDNCVSSTHLFVIAVEKREELLEMLYENEIYPGVHYRDNGEYDLYKQIQCDYAHNISEKIISLPLHLRLTKEDVNHIGETIKKCVDTIKTS